MLKSPDKLETTTCAEVKYRGKGTTGYSKWKWDLQLTCVWNTSMDLLMRSIETSRLTEYFPANTSRLKEAVCLLLRFWWSLNRIGYPMTSWVTQWPNEWRNTPDFFIPLETVSILFLSNKVGWLLSWLFFGLSFNVFVYFKSWFHYYEAHLSCCMMLPNSYNIYNNDLNTLRIKKDWFDLR